MSARCRSSSVGSRIEAAMALRHGCARSLAEGFVVIVFKLKGRRVLRVRYHTSLSKVLDAFSVSCCAAL